jgi:lipopolysaccharide export system permease protein
MRILTRYLIRSSTGPFVFALTVLSGLVFLNAVALRVEDLAGKGLPWSVIGEFLLLSLPHVVALTLPMAVLVAVLYTFSDLTAGNELTAMAAGGIPPKNILLPLLGAGAVLCGAMYYFNDQVLPKSNHRLANLMVDVGRKSPTFELREQVANEISSTDGATRIFLTASRIDPTTNELEEVVIHDLSAHDQIRTIYANNGTMAFNEARTDLYLTLYDGEIREVSESRPGSFNHLFFQQQIVPLRSIANAMERRNDVTRRSDREMSIGELITAADEELASMTALREESLGRSRYAIRRVLGIDARDEPFDEFDTAELAGAESLSPDVVDEETMLSSPSQADEERILAARRPNLSGAPPDAITQTVAMNYRTNVTRMDVMRLNRSRYQVEVHKKLSISFACLVFVLLGAPMAIRFPRGGAGMVIAVSVGIFSIYWIGLIGGERLADQGFVSPFWGMWTPNILFMIAGLWMAVRMGRETTSTRGGGWDDLLYTARQMVMPGFLRRGKGARA